MTNRLYRDVAYTKIHQGFEYEEDVKVNDDMAILTLDEPVTFTEVVYPICLPPRNKNYDETKATVAGKLFLVLAKPINSSRGELSFFLFNHSSKEGQNSPNKHGNRCSLGHKFQI